MGPALRPHRPPGPGGLAGEQETGWQHLLGTNLPRPTLPPHRAPSLPDDKPLYVWANWDT